MCLSRSILSPYKTENETPSGSDVLRTTNQTNHAKFRSRMLPAHGTIQLGLSATGVFNAQRGIEEYRAKIEEKNREINELNQQIDNVGR